MADIFHGDALAWLMSLPDASADALITDPPYSSGGLHSSQRRRATGAKYLGSTPLPDFAGDSRDQRSYFAWSVLWLSEVYRVLKPGSPVVVFSDWRQHPLMTDILQAAGFVWRGTAVWDKTQAVRPQLGRFRAQAEYMVWGSKGPMSLKRPCPVLPGVITAPSPRKKTHQTEKPLELLNVVVKIVEPDGLVLDPFVGSGAIGEACLMAGLGYAGSESVEAYHKLASERLERFAA